MSSPTVTLNNQIVSAIQQALAPLPALSADEQLFDPLGALNPDLCAEVLERASREIQTVATLGKADLAVLKVRQEDWRPPNKRLVPAWACVFRFSSDPSELARLVAAAGPANPLSLPSFNLGRSPRPGVIAVHQPVPFGDAPGVRLFVRLGGFIEHQDTWDGFRFAAHNHLFGSDYFEARLMQDGDDEPHQVLEVLSGASMLFGAQKDRMSDALSQRSIEELRLPDRILKKLRKGGWPVRSVTDLAHLNWEDVNDRLPAEDKLSRADRVMIQEALAPYGFRFR